MSYTHHELSSIVVVHNITVAEPGVKFKGYPPQVFFACQFESSSGPASLGTLNPPSKISGSATA